jgi:hypothetical protein
MMTPAASPPTKIRGGAGPPAARPFANLLPSGYTFVGMIYGCMLHHDLGNEAKVRDRWDSNLNRLYCKVPQGLLKGRFPNEAAKIEQMAVIYFKGIASGPVRRLFQSVRNLSRDVRRLFTLGLTPAQRNWFAQS